MEKNNKKKNNEKNNKEKILEDPRFSNLKQDPRFKKSNEYHGKLKLDDRFKSIFSEDKNDTMDPRGRPQDFSTKDNLRRFYDLSSEESSNDSSSEEEQDVSKNMMAFARGEKELESDDSDSDESDESEFEWGELDHEAQWDVDGVEVETTTRLAVCNMDWETINSQDLFVLLSSFVPIGGSLKKVSIYVSEFGKQRMKDEDMKGPSVVSKVDRYSDHPDAEVERLKKLKQGEMEDDDVADQRMSSVLRKYKRDRLNYYYGVVECDSLETSTHIYKECDRTCFEATGLTIDLRYIPSDMEFDEAPTSVCTRAPDEYELVTFESRELSASKPKVSWDETDPKRTKALANAVSVGRNKKEFNESLIREYVGSNSSEDESENEALNDEKRAKLKSILAEMEATENAKKSMYDDEDEDETAANQSESDEEVVEDKKDDLTPFQRFLEKRTAKKHEKKQVKKQKKLLGRSQDESDTESSNAFSDDELPDDAQDLMTSRSSDKKNRRESSSDSEQEEDNGMDLMVMDQKTEEQPEHFRVRDVIKESKTKNKWSKKKKSKETTANNLDVVIDDRFAALLTNKDFGLDPTHPKYFKSETMDNFIQNKKRDGDSTGDAPRKKKSKRAGQYGA